MDLLLNIDGLRHLWKHIMLNFDKKVDKENGKCLSTNDYTDTDKANLNELYGLIKDDGLPISNYTADEKIKLAGIEEGANKTIVDSKLSDTSDNPVQNKIVSEEISKLNKLVG